MPDEVCSKSWSGVHISLANHSPSEDPGGGSPALEPPLSAREESGSLHSRFELVREERKRQRAEERRASPQAGGSRPTCRHAKSPKTSSTSKKRLSTQVNSACRTVELFMALDFF